jgi:hypothetical protein
MQPSIVFFYSAYTEVVKFLIVQETRGSRSSSNSSKGSERKVETKADLMQVCAYLFPVFLAFLKGIVSQDLTCFVG